MHQTLNFIPPSNAISLLCSWVSIFLNILIIIVVILERRELRQTSSRLRWRPSHIHMMCLVVTDLVFGINYSVISTVRDDNVCIFCTIDCVEDGIGFKTWMCIYQATIMLNRWLIVVITFQRVRFIQSFRRVSRDNKAMITQLLSQGALALTVFGIYAVVMNSLTVDLPLETLPFNVAFLALMLPMTALIVYRTRGRTSEAVVECQRRTFVVAFFSCLSASIDIAAKAPLLSHILNGCIKDEELDRSSIFALVISAQFFDVFNCTINIFIYLALSKEFRRVFIGCFTCRSLREKVTTWKSNRASRREENKTDTPITVESENDSSTVSVISLRRLPEV